MTYEVDFNIQTKEIVVKADNTAEQRRVESEKPINNPLNKFQFEAGLFKLGLSLSEVENVIDRLQLSTDDKALNKSRVRNSLVFHRDNPLLNSLKGAFNLTDEQIDEVWLWAKDQK